MQQSRPARRSGLRVATLLPVAAGVLLSALPATAAPASVYLFNVNATTLYAVSRNGVPVVSTASSEDAALMFSVNAAPGDLVAVARDGDLQPPSPPVFSGLAGTDPGCARASWLPGGDPTVVGYVVGYGGRPASGGASYDYTADAGTAIQFQACSLPAGTWYFAVRARNHAGMLGAWSPERAVVVITVAVLISEFDARAASDGVHLRWRVSTDELVQGYRVYRRAEGDGEIALHAGTLPPDDSRFVDRDARHGVRYTYTLAVVREDGEEVRSLPVTVTTPALELALEQNFPNPFNPVTSVAFSIPSSARVEVRVHDVRGARVATLFDGRLGAGRHVLEWSGRDDAGSPVASGTYFYTLVAGGRSISRKMVLLK